MWHCKTYFVNKIVGKTLSNTLFWSWLSRIDYFENNRQNLCSHPQLNFWLVIFANNWLFSDITSCYLKISSCRWLKKITGCYFPQQAKTIRAFIDTLRAQSLLWWQISVVYYTCTKPLIMSLSWRRSAFIDWT